MMTKQQIIRFSTILITVLSLSLMVSFTAQAQEPTPERPNVVLFVTDDMGYSDLGAYGGEIDTPTIDGLASEGVMFTNFHTGPNCSPSRSMLITGVDNHLNGMGNMLENLEANRAPNQTGKPGYEGVLNERVVTLAKLLNDGGYHTYVTGKWHLGGSRMHPSGDDEPVGRLPNQHGFEQSYVLVEGQGDHYTRTWGATPLQEDVEYAHNGQYLTDDPAGFYSTDFFTDQMIEFIEADKGDDKPFFAMLSYTAPHWPLMAPEQYIQEYLDKGSYANGWDELRQQRFQRMQELGVISDSLELPALWPHAENWESLTASERLTYTKEMAVYAAMIDYLDIRINDFIQYLKDSDEYTNTIIIFMSDNGGDAHDRSRSPAYKKWYEKWGDDFDLSYENLGGPSSLVTLRPEWVQVSMTPFWGAKASYAEGGIRAPFILSYPAGNLSTMQTDAFASVLDVVPTILDYAQVEHPGTGCDTDLCPPNGKSMRSLLEGNSPNVYTETETISFEALGLGEGAVFMGDWKLVKLIDEWGDGSWKLYNMKIDPREGGTTDLSSEYPEVVETMSTAFYQYLDEVGYVPAFVTPTYLPLLIRQ